MRRQNFLADLRDAVQGLAQALLGSGHAAELPHEFADLAVEGVGGAVAVHRDQPPQPVAVPVSASVTAGCPLCC